MMLTMVTRFECDDAIAKSIIKLNEKGYRTRFCCSGHENEEKIVPYISFDITATLILNELSLTYYALPTNWIRKPHNIYSNAAIYRYFTEEEYLTMTDEELIDKAMKELEEWVDILPDTKMKLCKIL